MATPFVVACSVAQSFVREIFSFMVVRFVLAAAQNGIDINLYVIRELQPYTEQFEADTMCSCTFQ